MILKRLLAAVLLIFVAGSFVYWIVDEIRSRAQSAGGPSPAATERPDRVVVYYFHGAARCDRCVKFETYSSEALHEAFSRELADGRIEWRVVDVEEPSNEHFVEDYQLTSKAVIAARYKDSQQVKWKDLEEIWALVDDRSAFMKYIQAGVAELLNAE